MTDLIEESSDDDNDQDQLKNNNLLTHHKSHNSVKKKVPKEDEYFLMQEDYDDLENRDCVLALEMGDAITAIELSENGQFLLANVSMTNPRIELWDLESGECQKKFRGHIQSKYVLKPAFGGVDERLILCGSEDTNICIWYRQSGELIAKLEGHFQIINAVSWHPKSAILFASASDDTQIKLWSVPQLQANVQNFNNYSEYNQKNGVKKLIKQSERASRKVRFSTSNNEESKDGGMSAGESSGVDQENQERNLYFGVPNSDSDHHNITRQQRNRNRPGGE